jgi:hypothetical protein
MGKITVWAHVHLCDYESDEKVTRECHCEAPKGLRHSQL